MTMRWIISILLLSALTGKIVAFTGCTQGAIKLVGGSSFYGVVQVCIGGEWGTVCRAGWDSNDAAVVCRQLGYPASGASTYSSYSYYYANGAIYMSNVNCHGTELSIFQCDYQSLIGDYSPCYGHNYDDAGVWCSISSCVNGQVRLTGGDVTSEGNLEICNGSQWYGVCSYNFNYADAVVVCRQLGLPISNVAYNYYRYTQYPIMQTYSSSFYCSGSENSLASYSTGCCASSTCDFSSRAGVRCGETVVQTNARCTGQSSVRLVNGSDENEGRVEVCDNGLWTTIYGGGWWESQDGQVLCRQLGFQYPEAFIYTDNTFGSGIPTGPSQITYHCSGSELTLSACWHVLVYDSNPRISGGVRCENYPINQYCQPNSVRLSGGSSAQEGRIELCVQTSPGVYVWGSVCNAQNYGVAEVVCRQLGYSRSGAALYIAASSQNTFVLDDPYCSGSESNLLNCWYYSVGSHRCHRGQEVGVKCQSACVPGSVQLVNGASTAEGRVEMCINGSWISFYGWSENAANVTCRQIFGRNTFGTSHYTSGIYPYIWGAVYGYGTGLQGISQISCYGNETNLTRCNNTISSGYGHYYDAGVRCYVVTNCTEGQVRLAGGNTTYEGRVEVCRSGVWVAMHDNGWGYNGAIVVCRQLGLPYEWAIPYGGSYFGRGAALIELYYIYCSGYEASIGQCSYSTINRQSGYNSQTLLGISSSSINSSGVRCIGPSTNVLECSSGDMQLAGGPNSREGRLKVCKRDGYWASVCVNGLDKTAALIVCKSLGINITGVQISSGLYRTSYGPILSGIQCSGVESHIKYCSFGSVGTLNCGHNKDAVISCLNELVTYDVTITTDPPIGPFAVGSSVSLYCHSNPPFPPGVTYTWRAAIPSSAIRTYGPQANNATVTIGFNHPSMAHYYCDVANGTSLLGVGKADITVQSLITTNLKTTVQLSPPKSIILSVNVTEIYLTQYLRALTWYHDGNSITAGGRVTLSPDHTTLTIMNTVESDAGIYEVKHMGLVTSNRQEKCEARTLSALRKYPILAGLKFTVAMSPGSMPDRSAQIVLLNVGGSQSLQLQWNSVPGSEYMWPYITNSLVTSVLYYNGQEGTPIGAQLSSVQLNETNSAYQNFTIPSVVIQDSGYLDASLVIDPYVYLSPYWGSYYYYCPYDYYSFVSAILGITSIQLDSTTLRLAYTTQPQVVIKQNGVPFPSTVTNASVHGGAVLTCAASVVGYPPFITARWIKNGETVTKGTNMTTVDTGMLVNPYGLYVCSVDNTVMETKRSVLVKGKGTFQLKLYYPNGGKCNGLSDDKLRSKAISTTATITSLLTILSSCTLDTQMFENSTMMCLSNGDALLYSTNVWYASETGDIIGATLVGQLLEWFLGKNSSVLTVDEDTFKVNPVVGENSPQGTSSSPLTTVGSVTGGVIGGVVLGLLLAAVINILYFFKKSRKGLQLDRGREVPPVRYEGCENFQKVFVTDLVDVKKGNAGLNAHDDSCIYEPMQ